MRISGLARASGVGVETVRYYQRLGLLGTPEKPQGGFRSYDESDLIRLRFIRRAQQLGFSLEEIASLLRLSAADCDDVQTLAVRKLGLVQDKIRDLTRMAGVLEEVLSQCRARKPHEGCPIIETLTGLSDPEPPARTAAGLHERRRRGVHTRGPDPKPVRVHQRSEPGQANRALRKPR